MKKWILSGVTVLVLATGIVIAKDKPIAISANQTAFSSDELQTLGNIAKSSGATEPFTVSQSGDVIVFKGASGTCEFQVRHGTTQMTEAGFGCHD